MTKNEQLLFVNGLFYTVQGHAIISDANLELMSGEIIGILGPNGSGKSTLLKMISGDLIPNSGMIFLDSKNIKDYSRLEISQKLAVLPQDGLIPIKLEVESVIRMGRYPYRSKFGYPNPLDDDITSEVMRKTDTLSFRNRMIDALSGGERQRTAIAKSMAQTPKLLLLDEPTASLDLKYQLLLLDLLRKWNITKSLSIIIVLHDINLAAKYCDRIYFLKEGKILLSGATDDIITEENICKIFDVDCTIVKHPQLGIPQVLLL